ncbi:MAG: hypothetical protein O3B38_00670 [Chloroflexi bacterium]|nr:hypothetical protein [Chloroflexota bacterium]
MRYLFKARRSLLRLAGSCLPVGCCRTAARLELVYHRPWEADTPPVATLSVAVVVK